MICAALLHFAYILGLHFPPPIALDQDNLAPLDVLSVRGIDSP